MEVGYAAVAGCPEYGMDADTGEAAYPVPSAGILASASGGVGGGGECSAMDSGAICLPSVS